MQLNMTSHIPQKVFYLTSPRSYATGMEIN